MLDNNTTLESELMASIKFSIGGEVLNKYANETWTTISLKAFF